jgi:hypothetical protein
MDYELRILVEKVAISSQEVGSVHMTQDTCGKKFLPTSSARF